MAVAASMVSLELVVWLVHTFTSAAAPWQREGGRQRGGGRAVSQADW